MEMRMGMGMNLPSLSFLGALSHLPCITPTVRPAAPGWLHPHKASASQEAWETIPTI